MEKSKATTSKMVDSTSETCKGCKKVLSDSNKLRHITHTTCRQHYSKEEMNHFRDLAAERKSLKEKEYYSKNKESIRAKREEKLEQSKRNRQDPLILTLFWTGSGITLLDGGAIMARMDSSHPEAVCRHPKAQK